MEFIDAKFYKPDENEDEVLVYIESVNSFDVAFFKKDYNCWQGKKQQYMVFDVTAFCRIEKESLNKLIKKRKVDHDKKLDTGPA